MQAYYGDVLHKIVCHAYKVNDFQCIFVIFKDMHILYLAQRR